MKKALSLLLALLMLTGCCCVFAAAEEYNFIDLADPDSDTLKPGDWYFDWNLATAILSASNGSSQQPGTPEFEEYKQSLKNNSSYKYDPDSGAILQIFIVDGQKIENTILPGDENYSAAKAYIKQVPSTSDNNNTENNATNDNGNAAPKLNFFQRIIEWFRNLFAKLFK